MSTSQRESSQNVAVRNGLVTTDVLDELLDLHLDASYPNNYSHRLFLLLANHLPVSSLTFYEFTPTCLVLDHYGEPLFERELAADFNRGRQAILTHFAEVKTWAVLTQRELFAIIGGAKVPPSAASHSIMVFPLQPTALLLVELTRKSKAVVDNDLATLLSKFLSHFQPHRFLHSKDRHPSSLRTRQDSLTPTRLSDRQKKIHALLAQGWKNKAIAQNLAYSESLIRKETMTIFRFYGVAYREELQRHTEEMIENHE